MHLKQTIKYRKSLSKSKENYVNPNFPIEELDVNKIRSGFEDGSIKEVTIKIANGNTIIYELEDAKEVKFCPKAHTIHQRKDLPFIRIWITCEEITIASRTWNTEEPFDQAVVNAWINEEIDQHNKDSDV